MGQEQRLLCLSCFNFNLLTRLDCCAGAQRPQCQGQIVHNLIGSSVGLFYASFASAAKAKP